MFCAATPGEGWWDVHRCSELGFGDREGCVAGDAVVEGFEEGDSRVGVLVGVC